MANIDLLTGSAQSVAVGAASAQFGTSMVDGQAYELISTTACWFAIGANPTAAAHAGASIYCPANLPRKIYCLGANVKVAVIQDAAGGFATLSQLAG